MIITNTGRHYSAHRPSCLDVNVCQLFLKRSVRFAGAGQMWFCCIIAPYFALLFLFAFICPLHWTVWRDLVIEVVSTGCTGCCLAADTRPPCHSLHALLQFTHHAAPACLLAHWSYAGCNLGHTCVAEAASICVSIIFVRLLTSSSSSSSAVQPCHRVCPLW